MTLQLIFDPEKALEGWAKLQGNKRMSALFSEYLTYRELPDSRPWAEQTPRWQRAISIISPIYQVQDLILKIQTGARHCPFAG